MSKFSSKFENSVKNRSFLKTYKKGGGFKMDFGILFPKIFSKFSKLSEMFQVETFNYVFNNLIFYSLILYSLILNSNLFYPKFFWKNSKNFSFRTFLLKTKHQKFRNFRPTKKVPVSLLSDILKTMTSFWCQHILILRTFCRILQENKKYIFFLIFRLENREAKNFSTRKKIEKKKKNWLKYGK